MYAITTPHLNSALIRNDFSFHLPCQLRIADRSPPAPRRRLSPCAPAAGQLRDDTRGLQILRGNGPGRPGTDLPPGSAGARAASKTALLGTKKVWRGLERLNWAIKVRHYFVTVDIFRITCLIQKFIRLCIPVFEVDSKLGWNVLRQIGQHDFQFH